MIGQSSKSKYIRNAHVGLLHLEHTTLWLGPGTGPRLVSYVPLDRETRERLERLEELADFRDGVRVEADGYRVATG